MFTPPFATIRRAAAATLLLAAAGLGPSWADQTGMQSTTTTVAKPGAATPSTPAGTTTTTQSGLILQTLTEGKGSSPSASDTVKVHYRGTFTDGREFDSSIARGEPAEFPLKRVIKCWTEGVQKMKVGGKARLTCPPAIAYGERGAGGVIPPNATLNFEIELLAIKGKP